MLELARERVDVVIVLQTTMLLSERRRIAELPLLIDCHASMDIANTSMMAG